MKRKIFSVLFALVLVVSFSLVTAVPVSAASVGTVTVTVEPNTQNLVGAKHTITFNTSSTGALAAGEFIWVNFVDYCTNNGSLPLAYVSGDVTVNDALVATGNASLVTAMAGDTAGEAGTDNIVMITTPVDIAAGASVEVVFETSADITNPDATGAQTLQVQTSTDTDPKTSTPYVIAGATGGRVSLYNRYDVFVNSYNTITETEAEAAQYYTIKVDAGTYIESFTINVPDLTLESTDGAASTIIKGRISLHVAADRCVIGGAAGKGFTLEGGTSELILLLGPDNVTISYNTLDTTYTSASNGIMTRDAAITGLTVSNNTFILTEQYDMGVYGATTGPNTNLTISNNTFTGTSNLLATSAIEIVELDIEVKDSTISGNTITSTGNGVVIGTDQAGGGLQTGTTAAGTLKIIGNTFDGCYYGLDMVNANADGDEDQRVIVVGNTFSDNKYGFAIDYGAYPASGDGNLEPDDWSVMYNNFSGNTLYGLYNNVTIAVAAHHCWWGDATGPSGVGTGSGDKITTYVTYLPCLGASVSAADYVAVASDALSLNAQTTVGVWVTSSQAADIGVAKYTGNPQGPQEFSSIGDFDVYAYRSWATADLVTIKLYADGVDSTSTVRFWSDTGNDWIDCYEQGAATGYVWVNVRSYAAAYPERVPVLTDLIGMPFYIIGEEVEEPFDPIVLYDDNGNGIIDKSEALTAVTDYFAGDITKANALEVIVLYFAS